MNGFTWLKKKKVFKVPFLGIVLMTKIYQLCYNFDSIYISPLIFSANMWISFFNSCSIWKEYTSMLLGRILLEYEYTNKGLIFFSSWLPWLNSHFIIKKWFRGRQIREEEDGILRKKNKNPPFEQGFFPDAADTLQ